MIGIGITTRNRQTILAKNLKFFKRYTPETFKIVIVDDGSDIPFEGADFRFEERQGIAKAKNKCFDLLKGCSHCFLFDDDCYPIADNWFKPYINSREPHLMYIYDRFSDNQILKDSVLIYYDDQILAYTYPRGCMLYFDLDKLGEVARMNEDFKIWGWEHVSLSDKIFNNNFTTYRYMDVRDSKKLIFSMDEHRSVVSSVSNEEKTPNFAHNENLYQQLRNVK